MCACSKTIHHGVVIGFQYSALQASFTLSRSDSGTMSRSLSRCSHRSYIRRPSRATLTCRLVFSVGAFVIPFFPSRIDVPQTVQGVIGPSLSSPLSIRHPSRARATSCVVLVGCLGGGVRFPLCSVPTWHPQSSICSSLFPQGTTQHHPRHLVDLVRIFYSPTLVLPSGTSDLFRRLRGSVSRCYPPP